MNHFLNHNPNGGNAPFTAQRDSNSLNVTTNSTSSSSSFFNPHQGAHLQQSPNGSAFQPLGMNPGSNIMMNNMQANFPPSSSHMQMQSNQQMQQQVQYQQHDGQQYKITPLPQYVSPPQQQQGYGNPGAQAPQQQVPLISPPNAPCFPPQQQNGLFHPNLGQQQQVVPSAVAPGGGGCGPPRANHVGSNFHEMITIAQMNNSLPPRNPHLPNVHIPGPPQFKPLTRISSGQQQGGGSRPSNDKRTLNDSGMLNNSTSAMNDTSLNSSGIALQASQDRPVLTSRPAIVPGSQKPRATAELLREERANGSDGEDCEDLAPNSQGNNANNATGQELRQQIAMTQAFAYTGVAAASQLDIGARFEDEQQLAGHIHEVLTEMKQQGKPVLERLIAVFGELNVNDAEKRADQREERGLPPVDRSAPLKPGPLEEKISENDPESMPSVMDDSQQGNKMLSEKKKPPELQPPAVSHDPLKITNPSGTVVEAKVTWLAHEPHEVDQTLNKLSRPWPYEGLQIHFSYDAILQPQKLVMAAVAKAIKYGRHAVLESPTGTGKTAALLCAALAAQRFLSTKYGAHPQIIYGTRTQGQVKQVVKELKKSPYRPAVTCLGSREKICSNLQVKQAPGDMRSKCAKARKVADRPVNARRAGEISCSKFKNMGDDPEKFAYDVHANTRPAIGDPKRSNLPDIEDLVKLSEEHEICPYFLAQTLSVDADIVVCPYNYILDPRVRENSKVSIKDRVIILDEAHNIESVCKDAGSKEIPERSINGELPEPGNRNEPALTVFEDKVTINIPVHMKFPKGSRIPEQEQAGPGAEILSRFGCNHVSRFFRSVANWMEQRKNQFLAAGNKRAQLLQEKQRFNLQSNHKWEAMSFAPYKGIRVGTLLDELKMGIGIDSRTGAPFDNDPVCVYKTLQKIQQAIAKIKHDDTAQQQSALDELDAYLSALVRLCENPESYAASLMVQLYEPRRGPSVGAEAEPPQEPRFVAVLCLYLLYPAVTFERVSEQAHSVILASGTLCPVESFFSELGQDFADRQVTGKFLSRCLSPLEAEHVIGPEQLLVQKMSVVGSGNRLQRFSSDYNTIRKAGNWNEPLLRDLGLSLVKMCSDIPGGVLIFFPSYTFLNKIAGFWRSNFGRCPELQNQTIWDALEQTKKNIVKEESALDIEELKAQYSNYIEQDGEALLLGVMRAKCSEGISFNDHYCRAVIVVGLAYPAREAPEIKHKMQYNTWWRKAVQQQQALNDRNAAMKGQAAPAKQNVPITGDAWYGQEAFRAINQALGRCVRHKDDYGCLILLDARWSEGSGNVAKLAQWLRAIGIEDAVPPDDLQKKIKDHFNRNTSKRRKLN
ncbi:unnamed protein product [Amoebophrya sp. A120]|nr:unnamed protein product [Amoebophrya sp. A120]|eukprot:GSA120T00005452001.1